MDEIVALGWIVASGGAGLFLGAAIGHYAALRKQEQDNNKTSDKLNDL